MRYTPNRVRRLLMCQAPYQDKSLKDREEILLEAYGMHIKPSRGEQITHVITRSARQRAPAGTAGRALKSQKSPRGYETLPTSLHSSLPYAHVAHIIDSTLSVY